MNVSFKGLTNGVNAIRKVTERTKGSLLNSVVSDTFQRAARLADNTGIVQRKIIDPATGKISKIPERIKVESKNGAFLFRNAKNEIIGGVRLDIYKNLDKGLIGIFKDMPEYGIVGDRVVIKITENIRQEEYSGVAKLADQIAVEYCLKNKIPANIVFDAAYNSHAVHYSRGMRFIPFSDIAPITEILKRKYGTSNPNEIVENIIKNTPEGQRFDTSSLGDLPAYMPREIVEKYLEDIKYNPILK